MFSICNGISHLVKKQRMSKGSSIEKIVMVLKKQRISKGRSREKNSRGFKGQLVTGKG